MAEFNITQQFDIYPNLTLENIENDTACYTFKLKCGIRGVTLQWSQGFITVAKDSNFLHTWGSLKTKLEVP